MSNVQVLPSDEEAAADPRAKQALEDARREMAERVPDCNEGLYSHEFNGGTGFQRQNQMVKAEAPAQLERLSATEERTDFPPAPRGKPAAETADSESSRQLQSWPADAIQQPEFAPRPSEPEPIDELEFFRSPAQAVEKAVAQHPIINSLRNAITETYQRKTAEEFAREFPQANEWIEDPKFREWAGASNVRRELLMRAHQYDLDAARHVFGAWEALRGGTSTKGTGKTQIFRRRDVVALMQNDPARFEELEPAITLAYKQGRVRDI